MSKAKQPKPQIDSIQLVCKIDTDPMLDHYGRYSNKPEEGCIDRKRLGLAGIHEYRYFIPADNGWDGATEDQVEKSFQNITGRQDPSVSIDIKRAFVKRHWAKRDLQRMEDYNKGLWGCVGIIAKARVRVCETLQWITSGGLWGIESDDDSGYFKEIAEEQVRQLNEVLSELGFGWRAIQHACHHIDTSQLGFGFGKKATFFADVLFDRDELKKEQEKA